MANKKLSEATKMTEPAHGFGGCNLLKLQYERIGSELSALDFGFSRYGFSKNNDNFRVGVSSVPVEVLESYCEDLLDIEVADEKLFICRRSLGNLFQILSILGLTGAFAWGLWSVARGASPVVSFFFTIFMAAPFAVLWHFSPRMQLMRRLGFARILSQEIFRRRGGGKGEGARASVLSELLSPRNARATLQGAAKIIYH
jgi:hypothetical protein